MDVSNDRNQSVDPLDVLYIVNELNGPKYTSFANRKLPVIPDSDRSSRPFFDTDCDGLVSPLDVLTVVNAINSGSYRTGWSQRENQQPAIDSGFITSETCGPKLHEGSSYLTELTTEVKIPQNATNLSFRISSTFFDVFSPSGMKDGFEASLVDERGRTLVMTYARNRDAFLNMGEGQSVATAPGVQIAGDLVSVNVSQIPADTNATLVVRLVNNDHDTRTSVAVRDVQIATTGTPVSINPNSESSTASRAMSFWNNVDRFIDVSDSVALNYRRTSHHEDLKLIHSEIAIENVGSYPVLGPLRVIFRNLSDPEIGVREADGLTTEGDPFLDFSSLVGGEKLLPGQKSAFRGVSFYNPNQKQFSYDVEVRGLLNDAPEFTSEPDQEALVGRLYSHDVDAVDRNGDTLTYSLVAGPEGMSIDASTGVITWRPSESDRGSHSVWVRVDDGFGGTADQRFILDAIEPPPNRPPVIVSTPTVTGQLNGKYLYDVKAIDEDGDSLVYSLGPNSPAGIAIDATGRIEWQLSPTIYLEGQRVAIEVRVQDPLGATAIQTFEVLVLADTSNSSPVIISDPITRFRTVAGSTTFVDYTYDVEAVDSDGDLLTYSLTTSSLPGLSIDSKTGFISGGADRGAVLAGPIVNPNNGHYYYLLAPSSWTQAQNNAVKLGGNLATVRSDLENDWIYSQFSKFGGVDRGLWIGLNDAEREGVYSWVSGESTTFRNWGTGEPATQGSGDDYVHLLWPKDGREPGWNDAWDAGSVDGLTPGFYEGVIPISGVVEVSEPGLVKLVVRVDDGRGGTDSQSFSIDFTSISPTVQGKVTTFSRGLDILPEQTIPNMLESRAGAATTVGADGKVYVFGGYSQRTGGHLRSAERYDPATNTWSALPDMPSIRYLGAAVTVSNGLIYVIGGSGGANTADVFDPTLNSWRTASLPFATGAHSAAYGADNRIYVFGFGVGLRETWAFDLQTESWQKLADSTQGRAGSRAIAASDGRIYLIGGQADHFGPATATEIVEAFDPLTNSWTVIGSLSTKRTYAAAALGVDGRIYVFGGADPLVGFTSSIEAYDPVTNTWFPAGNLNSNVYDSTAQTLLDGRTILFGVGNPGMFMSSEQVQAVRPRAVESESITWTVFEDVNRNGIRDEGEPFDLTDERGEYSLEVPTPGNVHIRLEPKEGWSATNPLAWLPSQHQVATTPGQNVRNIDFSMRMTTGSTSIRGNVFHDQNADGSRAANEPGIDQWIVYLDSNDNGQRDANETMTITNALGQYEFGGLLPGRYLVKQERQNGWFPTLPTEVEAAIEVQLHANQIRTGIDFGNRFDGIQDADLQVVDVDSQQLSFDGQALTVAGPIITTVRNQGRETITKPFEVIFFEDRDRNGAYDRTIDSTLGTTRVTAPLSANASLDVTASLNGSVLFSGNRIWTFIDSRNEVFETTEDNNVGVHFCEWTPQPGSLDPQVEWRKSSFTVAPESNQVMMAPVVIDLDGDGISEILFTTFVGSNYVSGGRLRAISGADGREVWTSDSQYPIDPGAGLAVGDIDNDGSPEVVATSINRLLVFEHTGQFKFATNTFSLSVPLWYGGPSLADLDADGSAEIIMGDAVFANTGSLLWKGGFGDGKGFSIAADLDMDGKLEVVTGSTAYRSDGTVLWHSRTLDGHPAVGNLDADPFPEVVVSSDSGSVFALDNEGTLRWGASLGSMLGTPTLADLDGDTIPEIGVAGSTQYTVLSASGSIKWQSAINDRSSSKTGSTVFDFDGDGRSEVVFADQDFLRIYDGTNGSVLYQTPNSSGTLWEYPVIADVDGDGNAEIIAASNNYASVNTAITVFGSASDTWVPTRTIWNQHAYHITNVNDDGTIPRVERPSWLAVNSYRQNRLGNIGDPLPAPDLTISYQRTSQVVGREDQVLQTIRIGNGGSIHVAAGIHVSVFDADPAKVGKRLGTVTTKRRLNPGTFEDVSIPVPSSSGKLWFVVDRDANGNQQVRECDESNNVYSTSATTLAENQSPKITSQPNEQASLGSIYRYFAKASDRDLDALGFDLVVRPNGMAIDPTSGRIGWFPKPNQLGEHEVILRVRDGRGGVDLQRFTVQVTVGNSSPIITSTAPAPAVDGKNYRYQVRANDVDGDRLTYSLISGPPGMSINANTGLVQWRAEYSWSPEYATRFDVDATWRSTTTEPGIGWQTDMQFDDSNAAGWEGSSRVGNLNTQWGDYHFIWSPKGNSVDVTWFRKILKIDELPLGARFLGSFDDDGELYINGNLVFDDKSTFAGPFGRVDITKYLRQGENLIASRAYDVRGAGRILGLRIDVQRKPFQFEVKISDGRGGNTTQRVELPIIPDVPNRPPKIGQEPRTSIRQGDTFRYDPNATDPDGDELQYSLSQAPSGMTVDALGVIQWQPGSGTLGQYPVTLQIRDGQGGAVDKQFTLVVTSTPKNNPPEIVSTPNPSAVVGREYRYDARGTDTDGDVIIWSLEAAPAGLQITPQQGLVRWTPSVQQIGDHPVVILAEDSYGGQARQTFSIQVRGVNTPPNILSSPPTISHVGRELSYQIKATDIDGDRLSYSLAGPASMILDRDSGMLRWTPTADLVGIHEITLWVSDGLATATQSFDLDVTQSTFNAPPSITSTPRLTAVAGSIYQYDVVATDAENDALTYALTKSPAGMSIDPRIGVLSWTPSSQQIDLHSVSIEVSDTTGGRSIQNYGLRVLQSNRPPLITSEPRLNVTRGARYSYDVRATDPDQQRLVFELLVSPPGMSIDDRGRVRWQTTGTSVSPAPVQLRVSDGLGGHAEQNFVVLIDADNTTPQIIVNASPSQGNVGEEMTFVVEDTDNIGVVERTLWIDGVAAPLDSTGRVTLKMMRLGSIPIRAEAKDAAGNVGRFEHSVQIIDPTDIDAPIVTISVPAENGVVRTIVDVVGTVSDSNLLYYTISIAAMDGEFREIARGTSNVTNGVLGKLDPTLLPNDSYRLKVEAFDAGGKSNTDERTISVEGNLKLGNFTVSFADLSVPVAGIPITVVRTYDSLNSNDQGDFGYGWRMEFRETKLRTSVPATGDEDSLIFNPFFVGAKVFVQLAGGKREGFTFQPRLAPGLRGSFLRIYEPAFVPDRGVTSQLRVPNANLSLTSTGDVFAYGGGLPFHPSNPLFGNSYVLTTAEGVSYDIDGSTGALRSIVDQNGNKLDFSESQIVSSVGPKIQFERDVAGRIVRVIDPAGQKIHYSYNSAGDLVAVTDRLGNETKYQYRTDRAHYLEKIIDPLGREAMRTEYDESGRLKRTLDASGQAIGQEYNLANSEVTLVDQLGNPTRFVYDKDGNITRETNALGEVILRTYDAAGNVLEETDPLGNKTTRTYDRFGNVLSEKDPLGNVTLATYGPNNQVLSSTDALGNTTRNEYDSRGNLLRTIDPNGVTTGIVYDQSGNPTSMSFSGGTIGMVYDSAGRVTQQTDAMGTVTSYTYDSFGNQLTSTTKLSTRGGIRELVTRKEYDANNRLVRTVDAEGGVTRVEYDKTGNKVADIDPLGRRTEYRYDSRGMLVETIYPDATPNDLTDNPRTRTEFDSAGRAIARIDELGRKTNLVYDKTGRLVETIYPDGTPNDLTDNPRARTEYDAAGRTVAQIDERGNRTEFEFDAAGRRIKVRDALGNETRSVYDNAGRQVAVTDSLNRVTRFSHDSGGRPVETTFADGTKTTSAFDTNGRLVRRTDQMGRSTRFEHDPLGRLVAVVDALGQRTEYSYDEAGNLVSQKDANGHVTRYEYDGLGRRIAAELPLGQRSRTEYDAVGKTTKTIDFNGDAIAYGYDARNRLTTKTFPGGSSVLFTYSQTGQRQSSVDARGTTLWQYDERGRMLSRTEPDGQRISYTYDAAGNRTSLTTAAGTVTYAFDVLNRPLTVSDPVGGITRYQYDAVSNLTRTEFPNGTSETRQYDPLSRLLYLENRNSTEVISSYRYTLAPTGRRDAVEEHTGRRVSYRYDALDRLTREQITDAALGDRSIEYSYDPVGNRLSRNDSGEGQTIYTYDDNDRLLTESLLGAITQYTYDNNGNTLSKIKAVDRVFYDWDFENRLTGVDTDGNGSFDVVNGYDADGIRVSQKVGNDETRYLIDTMQPYQQVAIEYTPRGVIKASYVHGLDLISQNRPAATGKSYYHVDGLGSTRVLTNSTGLVTDRYIYDAYGRTLGQVGTTGNVYLYAGEQRDAVVGMDYLRARWMRSESGRFASRDLFEGSERHPTSLQDYLYADANTVNLVDPSGFFSLSQTLSAINIRSSLGFANTAMRQIGMSAAQHIDVLLAFVAASTSVGAAFVFDDVSVNMDIPINSLKASLGISVGKADQFTTVISVGISPEQKFLRNSSSFGESVSFLIGKRSSGVPYLKGISGGIEGSLRLYHTPGKFDGENRWVQVDAFVSGSIGLGLPLSGGMTFEREITAGLRATIAGRFGYKLTLFPEVKQGFEAKTV